MKHFFKSLGLSFLYVFTFIGFVTFCLSALFVFSALGNQVILGFLIGLFSMPLVFFSSIVLIVFLSILLTLIKVIKELKSKK